MFMLKNVVQFGVFFYIMPTSAKECQKFKISPPHFEIENDKGYFKKNASISLQIGFFFHSDHCTAGKLARSTREEVIVLIFMRKENCKCKCFYGSEAFYDSLLLLLDGCSMAILEDFLMRASCGFRLQP